jgi:hypothetical protein
MQNRHEPSDRFVERLGQDIGAEVRRRNRVPAPGGWRQFTGFKTVAAAAALVVASMAAGGAVVAAAYQNENREQREALVSLYARKVELAKVRLDAAQQQLHDAERRFAAGLIAQDASLEHRQSVIEAEAQLRIATLNLEEVRATGREPRDEVSAPPVPQRDFVTDRLQVSMSIAKGALDLEMRKLQTAERRVRIGLEQQSASDALRARIVELESALEALQRKVEARQMFVANKYDAALADLRVGEIEAQQRQRALRPQLDLAKREMARIESLVTKGLAGQAEVAQARVRVLEAELKLSVAEAELSTVRAAIAQRTAGQGGGS